MHNNSTTGDWTITTENDDNVTWIQSPTTTSGTISVKDTNETFKIIDSDSSWDDSQISTGGTITIDGGDPEKEAELKELAEEQLEKVDELRDSLIDFLSRNRLSSSETEDWKSDLETVQRMKRKLEEALEDDGLMFSPSIEEKDVLTPNQLEKLNDIFNRWK